MYLSPNEIFNVINHVKITSAGTDNIHPNNIKLIAPLVSDVFSFIVNLIFKTGIFPEELRGQDNSSLQKGRQLTAF